MHTVRLGSQAFNALPLSHRHTIDLDTERLRSLGQVVRRQGMNYRFHTYRHPSFHLRRRYFQLSSSPGNGDNENQPSGLEGLSAEEIESLPDLGSFLREGVETIEEIMAQDIR